MKRKIRPYRLLALLLLLVSPLLVYMAIYKINPPKKNTAVKVDKPKETQSPPRIKDAKAELAEEEKNIPLTDNPGKITFLMYHEIENPPGEMSVSPNKFEEQMKYLADNGYHAISLDQFYQYRANNQPLPVKPIVITFDDGYRDNYTTAYPILKKYKLKATIFIISQNVGWKNYLTWDMLKEMKESGLVKFGGHTVTHPKLSQITAAQAETEIVQSKKIIEEKIGEPMTFFSYPYGLYNQKVIDITKKAGYQGAVIMGNGTADSRDDKNSNLFTLSRTFVGGNYDLNTFIRKVEVVSKKIK